MSQTNTIVGTQHFGKLSLGAEWQRSVRREQLSALVRMTPYLALVNIANALLLGLVLGDSVPISVMAPWVVAIIVIALFMLVNWQRNKRRARRGSGSKKAVRRSSIFAAVVGFAWAMAAPLFSSFLAHDEYVFLYIVLAGMVAGGAISLASVPRASIAFVSPILAVVLIFIIAGGEPEHFALGAMLVLFFAITALAQRETPSAISAAAASNYTRDLLTDILDMMPEGFALYDSNDRLFICNDTYRDSMPQLREMIVPGLSFEELVRAGAENGLVANMAGGSDAYVDARLKHHRGPDGPFEYYQTRGHWIRTHERRLADNSTIVIREDVTAQKLAEQARERSEERFRDFAESSADWLWEMDADLRFSYFSPNVENVIGVPPEWHYGKTRDEMLADDFDRELWGRHLQDLAAHRPFRDLTYLRRGGDGVEEKWLSTSGKPYFDDNGHFKGYRGVGRDITEQYAARIESENAHKRLSLALESMDQGFVLFDENDEFVLCNSRYREFNPEIAGMLVPGTTYEDLLQTTGGARFLEGVDRGENWFEERLKLHRADNSQFEEMHHDGRWVHVNETRTADGWHVGLRTDITEQKRTEIALRESHEKFQVIAETIPVPAVITRRSDNTILFANQATAQFTDRRVEDLPGRVLNSVWVDTEAQKQYFGELERSGRVNDFEALIRRSSGAEISVLVSSRYSEFDGEEAVFTSLVDITSRKEAERAAQESEAQLRLLLENSPIGVAVVWHEHAGDQVVAHHLFGNKALAEIVGSGPNTDLINVDIADSWANQRELQRVNRIMIDGGELNEFEALRVRPDGSERWISMNSRPIQFDGRDCTVIWQFDITERKQAEQALRESEQRLADAQAVAHVGNWQVDLLAGTIHWSDEVHRIFAIPSGKFEITEKTFIEATHGDDRGLVRDAIAKSKSEGASYEIEHRIVRPDNSERWVEERGSTTFDNAGKAVIFSGTVQDITERKLADMANERFLHAIENLSEGLAVFDPDDRLVVCNQQYRMTAGENAERLQPGSSYEEILRGSLKYDVYPDAVADPDAWIAERMEHHRNPRGDLEIVRSDRNLLIREERLADGSTVNAVLDVTELRQREEQLRQSQKLEAVGQLTSGIAHDFNNLLTAVLGNLELLQERLTGDDTALRYLGTAQRSSEHGAELIDRLLAFSRRQVLAPKLTDINTVVPHFHGLAQRALGEQIEIKVNLADTVWPVTVDQGQLENALLNLAINASDAMPLGGQLHVDTGNQVLSEQDAAQFDEVAPGDYVMIAVSDSGEGMTDETLSRAFDPFFTTKDVGEGTGLGLSMVFGFAKQSGGYVGLYSELGVGTTVRIYLPRAADQAAVADNTGEQAPDQQLPAGAETVLLVEDDGDVREFVAELLTSLGYRVLQAPDGVAALAIVESDEEIGLLLSDVVLPGGISGPDVATAFSAQRPNGKVILASGYPRNHLNRQGDIPNDAVFLKKPYRVAELAQQIREILDA